MEVAMARVAAVGVSGTVEVGVAKGVDELGEVDWGEAARSMKVSSMVPASGPESWLVMAATVLRNRPPPAPPGTNIPKLASSTTASAWASTASGRRWGPSEWAITSFNP